MWRMFVAVTMVATTTGLASLVSETWRGISFWDLVKEFRTGGPEQESMIAWRDDFGPAIAGVGAAWSLAAGAMLAAGFAHVRRRWVVWGALIAAVAGAMLMAAVQQFVDHEWRMLPGQEDHGATLWMDCDFFRRVGSWMVPGFGMALLGVPLGRSLRRTLAKRERMRWIRKLARARRRRMAL